MTTTEVIGAGVPSFRFAQTTGTIRRFDSPGDVIAAVEDDLETTIALVQSGGTTFLSPILGRLGGIIACDGTLRSHLAIVSREFEVPCIVGASLESPAVNGDSVTLRIADQGNAEIVAQAASTATGAVSAQWWDYINRVGDEIAVKDFDVELGPGDLEALIAEELTDEKLDALVQHMGRAFKPEMTRRSAFGSELFPMMTYMCLSTIEDFHTYADRIRIIEKSMRAEDIGRQLVGTAGAASPLWTWMSAYHYLCGRECLIQLGKIAPGDSIDDIRVVVDFWRRLTLAQRGDGTLDNKDAGFTNRYLPSSEVQQLHSHVKPLEGGELRALKRLNATVSGYSFLYFTDSRVGIYDSGPYPTTEGRLVIVRDYLCLQESVFGYPWVESTDHPPYAGLTMVLEYDPSSFETFEINDWGTTFTEPDQFLAAVTHAAVIGHHADGSRTVVPAAEWTQLMTAISKPHMSLYEVFAGMNRSERALAATKMYCWGLKPFAAIAGVTDDIDWEISPATLALYPDPLDDDDKAGATFGTAMIANDMPGAFSPLLP